MKLIFDSTDCESEIETRSVFISVKLQYTKKSSGVPINVILHDNITCTLKRSLVFASVRIHNAQTKCSQHASGVSTS